MNITYNSVRRSIVFTLVVKVVAVMILVYIAAILARICAANVIACLDHLNRASVSFIEMLGCLSGCTVYVNIIRILFIVQRPQFLKY